MTRAPKRFRQVRFHAGISTWVSSAAVAAWRLMAYFTGLFQPQPGDPAPGVAGGGDQLQSQSTMTVPGSPGSVPPGVMWRSPARSRAASIGATLATKAASSASNQARPASRYRLR